MKAYILTVTVSALLSAMASAMSPKGWVKYIQLVTGIVILFCITSPVTKLIKTGIDFQIPQTEAGIAEGSEIHTELVIDELAARIEADIKERMKSEFNADIEAEVKIDVNDKSEIEGVKSITITKGNLNEAAKRRLVEVYGVNNIYEK